MLPSHISDEPGTMMVLEALGFLPAKKAGQTGNISPILHAGMHLGEGTGAVGLFPLLDMACDIYEKMETFEEINVGQYEDFNAKDQ